MDEQHQRHVHLEAASAVSIPAALVLAAALLCVAEALGEIAAGVWYQAVWLPRMAGED